MDFNCEKVSLVKENYQYRVNSDSGTVQSVEKFTWETSNFMKVSIINIGPTFLEISTPDRHGNVKNILENIENYINGFILLNNKDEDKILWQSNVSDCELILSHNSVGGSDDENLILRIFISVSNDNSILIRTTLQTNFMIPIETSQNFNFKLGDDNLYQIDQFAENWKRPRNQVNREHLNFLRIVEKLTGRVVEINSLTHNFNLSKNPSNLFSISNNFGSQSWELDQIYESVLQLKFKIHVMKSESKENQKKSSKDYFPNDQSYRDTIKS